MIHRVSDGTRTVEPLGPDDSQIRFQGIFSGPDAELRARALNDLRLSGLDVWLTWQSFRYKVIVESFLAAYHSRWWISYRLSCTVVHQSGVAPAGISSTEAIISLALNSASASIAGTQVNLTDLSTAIGLTGALTVGTAAHTRAAAVASIAFTAVQNEVDQQSTNLITAPPSLGGPAQTASYFTQQVVGAASLANAVNARAHIGRICTCLNSTGA